MGKSLNKSEIEEIRSGYHKYCPKSKSNNIIFCPTEIIKKKNDPKLEWLNDHFKKIRKKSKKKKKTKVNMNKSKKKKKTKSKKRKSRKTKKGKKKRKQEKDV